MLTLHMREKHPIDDLFRRVLRDAEAAPPPAVWGGVVRRRHWGHRLLLRLERQWGLAMLLLLLISAPLAWWAMSASPGGGGQATSAQEKGVVPSSSLTPIADRPVAHHDLGASHAADAAASMNAPSDPARAEIPRSENTGEVPAATPTERSNHARLDPPATEGPFGANSDPEAHEERTSNEVATATAWVPREEQADLAGIDGARSAAIHLDRLHLLMAGRGTDEAGSGTLLERDAPHQYVLPGRVAWIGIHAGYHDLSGGWNGPSPTAEALNNDEAWQDQWTAGLSYGWRWRSGWSASIGVDVVNRRSRFLHQHMEEGITTWDVDTSWVITPAGIDQNIYTWNIDSLVAFEPGINEQYSATNRYTLLRVPIEIGWRMGTRRWQFSVRGGSSICGTIARRGQSLSSPPSDGAPELIDLSDPAIDHRFTMSIAGSIAADAGYLLTERWSVHLGPVVTRDLWTSGNPDPSLRLTSFGGLLRLEHELRMKERPVQQSMVE